ncbi:MAG: DUF3108 domain-containing protein [Verrucomicrobia bacterium]|nr:DUF3108 domain-containing protein [Verrucomicrobiota bacterium]
MTFKPDSFLASLRLSVRFLCPVGCGYSGLRNLRVPGLILAAFLVVTLGYSEDTEPSWANSVTTGKGPGKFPPPPNVHLTYRFGWSGITAAEADVRLVNKEGVTKTTVSGGTTGFARTLFKCDIDHECVSQHESLLPVHIVQDEKYAGQTVHTTIEFNSKSVTSLREVTPSKDLPKPRTLEFYPVYSLETALLWLRSQPLTDGEREVMAVYANNAAYLGTIKVVGRERIHIGQTDRNAIKVEFNFKTIDQHLQLKTYKRFKSGRGWLSDDENRLPLRIEADIFIGYVFAEIETSDVGM